MKIHGQNLNGTHIIPVVIPRLDENNETRDIVFMAAAVKDFSEFDALVQMPKPKVITRPGKAPEPALDHPEYKAAIDDYSAKKGNWLYIKSLSATEGLEWERVDSKKPDTWSQWTDELQESGLTIAEINKITSAVDTVNGFNEEAYQNAMERFLARRRTQNQ
jgi:hypothetical protein